MSLEEELEECLTEYLIQNMQDISIESIADGVNSDFDEELEKSAERKNKSSIFISYTGTGSYSKAATSRLVAMKMRFKVSIISKTRKTKSGIYDILDSLRNIVYGFEYEGKHFEIVSDDVMKSKSKSGFFKAQMLLEIKIVLP